MTSRTVWFAVAASLFAPQSLIAQPDCPTQLCSNVRKMVTDAGSRWKSFRVWDASLGGWRPTLHVAGNECTFETGDALQMSAPRTPRSDADFASYECILSGRDNAHARTLWEQLWLQARIALPTDDWKSSVDPFVDPLNKVLGGLVYALSSQGLGTVTVTLIEEDVWFEIRPPAAITSSAGPARGGLASAMRAQDYYDRGLAYFKNKEYDRAFDDFARAAREGNMARAWYYLGWIENERKRYEKAIIHLDVAIGLDPKSARSFAERAYSYRQLEQFTRAIQDLTTALTLEPNNGGWLRARALSQFRLRYYELALYDYEVAVEINPKDAEALYGRGVLKRLKGLAGGSLGDVSEGEADIAAAKLLRADIAEVMGRLGIKPGS